MNEQDYVFV
jgi:hypothetical protein